MMPETLANPGIDWIAVWGTVTMAALVVLYTIGIVVSYREQRRAKRGEPKEQPR